MFLSCFWTDFWPSDVFSNIELFIHYKLAIIAVQTSSVEHFSNCRTEIKILFLICSWEKLWHDPGSIMILVMKSSTWEQWKGEVHCWECEVIFLLCYFKLLLCEHLFASCPKPTKLLTIPSSNGLSMIAFFSNSYYFGIPKLHSYCCLIRNFPTFYPSILSHWSGWWLGNNSQNTYTVSWNRHYSLLNYMELMLWNINKCNTVIECG